MAEATVQEIGKLMDDLGRRRAVLPVAVRRRSGWGLRSLSHRAGPIVVWKRHLLMSIDTPFNRIKAPEAIAPQTQRTSQVERRLATA